MFEGEQFSLTRLLVKPCRQFCFWNALPVQSHVCGT
jgi:hypothetical protein